MWNVTKILLVSVCLGGLIPVAHAEHSYSKSYSKDRSANEKRDNKYGVGACVSDRLTPFLSNPINPVRPMEPQSLRSTPTPKIPATDLPVAPPASTDFNVQACKDRLPLNEANPSEVCLTAIAWCVARSIDGGTKRLEEPLVVEFPCVNKVDPNQVRQKACEARFDGSRLQDSDIDCSPTRPPEVVASTR